MLVNVKKLRPFLFMVIIVTTVGLLPFGIAGQVISDYELHKILEATWRAFMAFLLVFVISSSAFFGFKLLRVVGKLYQSTKDRNLKEYLQRVSFLQL